MGRYSWELEQMFFTSPAAEKKFKERISIPAEARAEFQAEWLANPTNRKNLFQPYSVPAIPVEPAARCQAMRLLRSWIDQGSLA